MSRWNRLVVAPIVEAALVLLVVAVTVGMRLLINGGPSRHPASGWLAFFAIMYGVFFVLMFVAGLIDLTWRRSRGSPG